MSSGKLDLSLALLCPSLLLHSLIGSFWHVLFIFKSLHILYNFLFCSLGSPFCLLAVLINYKNVGISFNKVSHNWNALNNNVEIWVELELNENYFTVPQTYFGVIWGWIWWDRIFSEYRVTFSVHLWISLWIVDALYATKWIPMVNTYMRQEFEQKCFHSVFLVKN